MCADHNSHPHYISSITGQFQKISILYHGWLFKFQGQGGLFELEIQRHGGIHCTYDWNSKVMGGLGLEFRQETDKSVFLDLISSQKSVNWQQKIHWQTSVNQACFEFMVICRRNRRKLTKCGLNVMLQRP